MNNEFSIICPKIGYHVTTEKKLSRYKETGCILAPVRFWPTPDLAKQWASKTGRIIILKINLSEQISYPLPDHKPARFTPQNVSDFSIEQ